MEYVGTREFCQPVRFWVIFEFELPVESMADLQALAQRWHDLGNLPFGEEYNAALQSITDELTLGRLKHVNTVDEDASVFEWNYRSFALVDGSLVNVPLFQSPDAFDGQSRLVAELRGEPGHEEHHREDESGADHRDPEPDGPELKVSERQ